QQASEIAHFSPHLSRAGAPLERLQRGAFALENEWRSRSARKAECVSTRGVHDLPHVKKRSPATPGISTLACQPIGGWCVVPETDVGHDVQVSAEYGTV